MVSKAGPRLGFHAASNLDVESKKAAHSKSSWQQPMNVFLTAGRPPCMEELHQEAQLNLQSLLQEEYEEQYSEVRITGQTFRYSAHQQPDTPPEPTPTPKPQSAKRLEFVFMPTTRRVNESETTTQGVRPPESSLSLPTTPDKQIAWGRPFPLPILEEKRWHQSCSTQANIVPINVSGQQFDKHASSRHSLFNTETAMNPKSTLRRRRTIIGFPSLSLRDQGHSNGPASHHPHSPVVDSASRNWAPEAGKGRNSCGQTCPSRSLPPALRKTLSDLGDSIQTCCGPSSPSMESVLYNVPASCNGPKDSTFSPPWQGGSFNHPTPSSPGRGLPGSGEAQCSSPCDPRLSPSANVLPPVDCDGPGSFFDAQDDRARSGGSAPCPASPLARGREPEGPKLGPPPGSAPGAPDPSRPEPEPSACRFRERSLSVSACSGDAGGGDDRRSSENSALSYPEAGSDGSASTDNVSALGPEREAQLSRRRSKSISLKKAKKKPSPPTRSVSLVKDEPAPSKDQRPRSLCIPLDHPHPHRGHHFLPSDAQGHSPAALSPRDPEGSHFSPHWYLSDWKASDPYRSLSSSSTATGTTVLECAPARGSSESLTSPSTSRATTPSQLSAEAEARGPSSPGRPTGLMSPSSGYSSQSETPTPTVPTSSIPGHPSHPGGGGGARTRPKIPERKSSLPPTSPMERSPKSLLTFDLSPIPPAHPDPSGVKVTFRGKTRVSRHHSDSTFGAKLAQKAGPNQPVMPVVTQSDLRSVRLRSFGRSEPEDGSAASPDPSEEPTVEGFALPEKKVKPPVAEKPPVAKRPPGLAHKPPPVPEESPWASPTSPRTPGQVAGQERPSPQDIYTVVRKPKSPSSPDGKGPAESPSPSSATLSPPSGSPGTFFPGPGGREDEPGPKGRPLPDRINLQSVGEAEKRRSKIPPPVPKKPSVLYLPAVPSPAWPGAADPRLTPSPIITLNRDAGSSPGSDDVPSPGGKGESSVPRDGSGEGPGLPGAPSELTAEEKTFASDKTAESIAEDDDEVFLTSRTTEDLFTVIHRSKRKLLGWKEPSDAFGSGRQSSPSPVKTTAGSPTGEAPAAVGSGCGGPTKPSSRNEDFKALLQKKGSKPSLGSRPSAAELLKTTNPLARRVITEFAVDLDGTDPPKSQP
uniref:NHS like 2 n=1 Tax=Ornithorhynchus anatinus TaxID=9258 RepID=A0A6I8PTM5_ORNAN